ncbi:hypothetical protein [Thermopirellula anaerolimosa]
MTGALDYLWPLLEAKYPIVAAHVAAGWPAGVHEWLVDLGLLVRAEDAQRVLCPECHEHFEEIIASRGPDESARLFVPCPKVLRARVPPEARWLWQVNLDGLVAALALTLGLAGRPAELLPRRLWRLGRTHWQGVRRDVLFTRGLRWEDAAGVRSGIVRAHRPVVFVPQNKPDDDFWTRRVPPVLALAQVATLGEQGLDVDRLELVAAIQEAEVRQAGQIAVVTEEQLKLTIRQQVKAEGKTSLTDDIFLQAYRQCGSVREAAMFLSRQTGREVSKDQVSRALKRAGGAVAVLNAEDSDSLQRGVASQRRDRFGKRLPQSKPLDQP